MRPSATFNAIWTLCQLVTAQPSIRPYDNTFYGFVVWGFLLVHPMTPFRLMLPRASHLRRSTFFVINKNLPFDSMSPALRCWPDRSNPVHPRLYLSASSMDFLSKEKHTAPVTVELTAKCTGTHHESKQAFFLLLRVTKPSQWRTDTCFAGMNARGPPKTGSFLIDPTKTPAYT